MTEKDRQTKFRDELVRNKEEILEKELDRAKKLFWLDESGEVYIKVNEEEFNLRERILLYLVGSLYSNQAGLAETEVVETKKLSEWLSKSNKTIGSRLSELKEKGYVDSRGRGKYKVKEQNVPTILDSIEEARK